MQSISDKLIFVCLIPVSLTSWTAVKVMKPEVGNEELHSPNGLVNLMH